MRIAVIVPTIRAEMITRFIDAWALLFRKHGVRLIVVLDGPKPVVRVYEQHHDFVAWSEFSVVQIMGDWSECIFNRTDACRNLGFAAAVKKKCVQSGDDIILTLDDDVQPILNSDPIAEHIAVLQKQVPLSWISTVHPDIKPMRGFPYAIRQEAEVVFSHGIWSHVPDLDAMTQLHSPELCKDFNGPYYEGPIPRGVFAPICGMNVAFKVKALAYCYWAPMGWNCVTGVPAGYNRWADILMGIVAKKHFDKLDWAIYTGKAKVRHTRASNVMKNLESEAAAITLGETFWHEASDEAYRRLYDRELDRWQEFLKYIQSQQAF